MEVQLIECKLIDIPKNYAGHRTFNKKFALLLSASINVEGQQSAIVIRPNPSLPGRYILVQGRHRFYAIARVLNEEYITSVIRVDMHETIDDMASISENQCRQPIKKDRELKSIERCEEQRLQGNPDNADQPTGGRIAGRKASGTTTSKSREDKWRPLEVVEITNSTNSAGTTNRSVRTTKRGVRVGNAVIEKRGKDLKRIPITRQDLLAKAWAEEVKRGDAIVQIANGMPLLDTIEEILGTDDRKPSPVDITKRMSGLLAPEKPKTGPTEYEWYDIYCDVMAAMFMRHGREKRFGAGLDDESWMGFYITLLCNDFDNPGNPQDHRGYKLPLEKLVVMLTSMHARPEKFRDDALLFRVVNEGRHVLGKKLAGKVKAIEKRCVACAFRKYVHRFVGLGFVTHGLTIEECNCENLPFSGGRCDECHGCGYRVVNCRQPLRSDS
jgi:hypothetical protein